MFKWMKKTLKEKRVKENEAVQRFEMESRRLIEAVWPNVKVRDGDCSTSLILSIINLVKVKSLVLVWTEGWKDDAGKWNIRHRVDQDSVYENGEVSVFEGAYGTSGIIIKSDPSTQIKYAKYLPEFINSFTQFMKKK